ncbi:MAG: hypothetical protein ACLQVF_17695 [Isosphaeraceae bacterium]
MDGSRRAGRLTFIPARDVEGWDSLMHVRLVVHIETVFTAKLFA